MTPTQLLAELRRRAIELIPDGDTLAYRGPRGVLTPELRDAIASDKPGLLALLRGEAVSDSLPGGCIHQRFEAQARRRPQAVAVTSEDGELTYGELNTRANRLAHHLLGLGVRTESRVGVCLPSGLEMVVAMLGILKAGGAYVPVEPTWSGPLLGALFSDAEIAVCVTGESIQTRLPAGAARVICLDPASATLAAVSDRDPGGWVETANLAYVMYRSAPTGQGLRGVATEHRAVVDRLLALGRRVDVTADDVLLAIQPPSSVMAPLEVLLPLGAGARLALGRRRTVAEGRDLSADLRECGATLLLATPSICRQLLAAGGSGTTGLRLLCGGEPMSSELARQVRAAGLSLWNLYGCAESMLSSTLDEVDGPGASAPLGHTQIHVLDTHLQPVPIGVTGEIHISGASLARGCWKRPALTAAQFIPSPFAPEGGARLYRTGDLARRRADGRIEWVGRIDGQARVRGYRIDASTVEVVLRTHPAVWEAVAVVRDNPPAASRLVAYLVPRRGAALSAAEMPGFVRGKLPPHLEPADYVLLEELPLTSDGKVDRRALPPPARGPREDDMDAACARTNLTKNQFLIWAGQQLQPEVPLYNITALFTIPGPVDRRHFQIAFQALVDGSDALRTVIEEVEGLPRRRVLPQVRYVVEGPDFSPSADPEARLRAWATERAQQPFDLGVRLFEAALAKVAEDRFVWLFKHHHLISDAWTIALCVRYATEFYRRSRAGTLAGAPALPPYEAFVAYERAQRDSALYGKAKAYWERKLAEEVEPLVLYGNTGPRRTTRVERISHDLGMERSRRLRALAASEVFATASANVGLLSLFVGLFVTYLYRISGNRRLALGTPILNRPSRAFKDTVGLFMQFAPLHISLDEGETFVSLIPKVRQELYEVLRHQRYTTANPPQRRHYEVVFNYNHSNNPVGWHFDGATVSTESVHPGHENDSLALQVHDYDAQGSFVIDFDFHCEVFTPAQRRQTIEHVLRVIDVFCEDPTRPLREVDVLTAAERRHLLGEFARSRALPPGPDSIVSVWQEQAGRTPEAAAVVVEGAQLTYQALDQGANQLARYLQARGVGPEVMVGVCLERSLEMVVAVLGILKAGGAYVPLDANYPRPRLAFMLQDARVRVLVTQQRLLAALPATEARVVCVDADAAGIAGERDTAPVSGVTGANLAYVIYTSGSTGQPRGVMIAHASLVNALRAWEEAYDLRSWAGCHVQMASLSFDVFTGDLVRALCTGGRLVLSPASALLAPAELFALMRREGVDSAEFVPAVLKPLVQHVKDSGESLGFMRLLVAGSDNWLVGDYAEVQALCGPSTRLINSYGVTEATIDSLFFEGGVAGEGQVPVGRPFANTEVYILDGLLQPVPLEMPGELYIGGAGLARGYRNRPELTAERFLPHPFSAVAGARVYRTGDRARFQADGTVEFLGRMDVQVKVRGYRVELGEVEGTLVQHPGVREAVVQARDEASGGKRLVAYVVPGGEGPEAVRPTIGELRSFAQGRLPDYMVPAAFVLLEGLPLTPNGKVDRRALPAPEGTRPELAEAYAAPRTPVEQALARIWSDALGIERVGVHDNFFQLGGHSVLAIRLMMEIQKQLGRRVPLPALFQGPTIAQLAVALHSGPSRAPWSPLVPLRSGGSRLPFFCVHQGGGTVMAYVGLARHLDAEQPFFGLQSRGLDGELEPFTSIEEMASAYLEAVRTIQPEGPYLLGGHSLGGTIAFEMARQLRDQGREVALLALIDAVAPCFAGIAGDLDPAALDDATTLADLARQIEDAAGVSLPISEAALRSLAPDDQLEFFAEQLRQAFLARGADETLVQGMLAGGVPMLRPLLKVARTNTLAVINYVPRPYPGPITVLRGHRAGETDPSLGWSPYASGPIAIHEVSGDHYSVMAEPHVRVLAERLQALLAPFTTTPGSPPVSVAHG